MSKKYLYDIFFKCDDKITVKKVPGFMDVS